MLLQEFEQTGIKFAAMARYHRRHGGNKGSAFGCGEANDFILVGIKLSQHFGIGVSREFALQVGGFNCSRLHCSLHGFRPCCVMRLVADMWQSNA